jgi:hypothetical protein
MSFLKNYVLLVLSAMILATVVSCDACNKQEAAPAVEEVVAPAVEATVAPETAPAVEATVAPEAAAPAAGETTTK